MAISFLTVYNRMLAEAQEMLPADADKKFTHTVDSDGDGPLLDSGEDSQAMELIRVGMGLDPNFWDNFMKICNNPEGLADLLNISTSDITNWSARVRDALAKVEKSDDEDKRNKMLQTGDGGNEGPIQDRDQEKQQLSYPSDTRPTP